MQLISKVCAEFMRQTHCHSSKSHHTLPVYDDMYQSAPDIIKHCEQSFIDETKMSNKQMTINLHKDKGKENIKNT